MKLYGPAKRPEKAKPKESYGAAVRYHNGAKSFDLILKCYGSDSWLRMTREEAEALKKALELTLRDADRNPNTYAVWTCDTKYLQARLAEMGEKW